MYDVPRVRGHLTYHGSGSDYLIVHDPGLDTAWVFRAVSGGLPAAIDDLRFLPDGPQSAALAGLEPVNGFEALWFAWYAFYPDTVVLDGRN